MTTYRLYRCNLCSDYLKPSDAASKEGFGVHFNGDTRYPVSLKRVSECERHICVACAKGVHDEFSKVTLAIPPTAG